MPSRLIPPPPNEDAFLALKYHQVCLEELLDGLERRDIPADDLREQIITLEKQVQRLKRLLAKKKSAA